MIQEQTTLPLGSSIRGRNGDRYIIEGLLGKGGFSAVYLVRDRQQRQQIYALKEVTNPDEHERKQLAFEADILKRLEHPTLPNVYQVFEDVKHKRVYLLMDYIEGRDLEVLRREQPGKRFSLPLVLKLLAPIVSALTYLHSQEKPVIHRDIKPANIIVTVANGDTQLVDFGLAKEYIEDKTTSIFRYGTPGYAAPEQYGQGTSIQTDVYGLGATFYTLLTGTIPVDALTRSVSGGRDTLIPPDQICPEIPAQVARLIERALSLNREQRFPTAAEFWDRLTEAARESTTPEKLANPLLPFTLSDFDNLPTTILSHKLARRRRRQTTLMFTLLSIGILALVVNGILFSAVMLRNAQKQQHLTPQSALATPHVNLTPTPTISPYPQLASCYAGSANISGVTSGPANIYFTHLQQQQDQAHGDFRGLSQAGPFAGHVDAVRTSIDPQKRPIHFSVNLPSLGDTLYFDGIQKIGGEIVGEFHSANTQGEKTGYYGTWDVLPC